MAMITVKQEVREFGPDSAGILMTPREFDRAKFLEGYRYELIHGVLIVSPIPSLNERDPNDELGHWLRSYQETDPQGYMLDFTVPEQTIRTLKGRRRADRVIWAGLGRLPRRHETPTIIAEFVSGGKRDRQRDYEEKREEYREINVKEYWIIDRFQRTLTAFIQSRGKVKKRVIQERQVYTTDLLPGFELPLAKLLALADRWTEDEPE